MAAQKQTNGSDPGEATDHEAEGADNLALAARLVDRLRAEAGRSYANPRALNAAVAGSLEGLLVA